MRKGKRFFIPALLISLLTNGALLFFLMLFLNRPVISTNHSKKILIKLFPEEKKKKKKKPKGQVVELSKPDKEEVPQKADYLSKYNSKVKKEQKAIRKKKGATTAKQVVKKFKKKHVKTVKKSKKKQKSKKVGKSILFKKKRYSFLQSANTPQEMFENIKTMENSGSIEENTASDDALLKVKNVGKVTLLNSRQFKYWDFFIKVKKAVKKQWHPDRAYMKRDPYGKIYPRRNRLTVLKVVLDKNGEIEKLVMLKKSGLPFLDEEALNALKKAGPFPNPPKGLIDENGKIIFNFGFYFELNSAMQKGFWK